tara:strand:- start:48 stop:503 length:456 start_codon:yes stop_codon:yes gene_type:complete
MKNKNTKIRNIKNKKYITYDFDKSENGYLVPIYNINDGFFEEGKEPQQVYLTVIKADKIKGPHLHYIRTGFFTCIKGDAKFVLKTDNGFEEFYSGENYDYLSIEVPTGIPAALQNIGNEDALVLNMPNPAWTPDMDDEYTADFSEYDFNDN